MLVKKTEKKLMMTVMNVAAGEGFGDQITPKQVAAGRVRGVAAGEGYIIERKQSVPAKSGRIRGVAAGEGGRI